MTKQSCRQANPDAYRCWAIMKQRCLNPFSRDFAHYGGKGIEVCEEWAKSFESFMQDMGEKPSGTCLGRINTKLGYYKTNCKWLPSSRSILNARLAIKVGDVFGDWKIISKNDETNEYVGLCKKCGTKQSKSSVKWRVQSVSCMECSRLIPRGHQDLTARRQHKWPD